MFMLVSYHPQCPTELPWASHRRVKTLKAVKGLLNTLP